MSMVSAWRTSVWQRLKIHSVVSGAFVLDLYRYDVAPAESDAVLPASYGYALLVTALDTASRGDARKTSRTIGLPVTLQ